MLQIKRLTALCTFSIILSANQFAQLWKPASAPLMTPWSEQINPEHVLPEYPRPTMERAEWLNLNGSWQFQQAKNGDIVPFKKKLSGSILVPFPWESALSGVRTQFDSRRAWYRREFTIPQNWKDKNILINFGAVDWEAVVYINGRCVGTHKGGYDAFSFDITDYINKKGTQELIVGVFDPGNDAPIAYGKQNNTRFTAPKGYSYTASSGIWQTVWLEPVAKEHITLIHLIPDIDKQELKLMANSAGAKKSTLEFEVYDGAKLVAKKSGAINKDITVNIPQPKFWSPDSPFLYDVIVSLKDSSGNVTDKVKSYAGMRKISLKNENGVQRLALNNEFVFQMGPLDQGYWPDGIYTAPTDEALRWDIEETKKWGFNMIRKHIKVEPERWYYHCDKIGILVWQDMPSTFGERTEADKTQFEKELNEMIKGHWNHPSIVNWVVFNEHWGLYDVKRLTEYVMAADPTRLVTGNSGIDARKPSIDYEVGHIKDNHSYRPPSVPLISSERATANGEYGAIGYLVDGHVWNPKGPWVHYNYKGKEEATAEYEKFIVQINDYIKRGLSAAIYTQWTDVESEMNGLYTYDRKIIKLDKDRVAKANRSTYQKSELSKGQTDAQHLQ